MFVYRECTKSLLSLKNAGYINCNLTLQSYYKKVKCGKI